MRIKKKDKIFEIGCCGGDYCPDFEEHNQILRDFIKKERKQAVQEYKKQRENQCPIKYDREGRPFIIEGAGHGKYL